MMLCIAAIAVTNSSRLFSVFAFMLLWNLLVLSFISLNHLSILFLLPRVSWM